MRRTVPSLALVSALALALALSVGLAACGDGTAGDGATTPGGAVPADTAAPTESKTTPAEDAVDAAAIYAANCAGCHGADGGGGSGPPIRGLADTERISRQVLEGGGGMPGFTGVLTAPQVDALARYVAAGMR